MFSCYFGSRYLEVWFIGSQVAFNIKLDCPVIPTTKTKQFLVITDCKFKDKSKLALNKIKWISFDSSRQIFNSSLKLSCFDKNNSAQTEHLKMKKRNNFILQFISSYALFCIVVRGKLMTNWQIQFWFGLRMFGSIKFQLCHLVDLQLEDIYLKLKRKNDLIIYKYTTCVIFHIFTCFLYKLCSTLFCLDITTL